jgi:chemotaxis protein MotB
MRRRKDDHEDTEAWLITYADMVTLLLCFFVIMFAVSTPNGQMVQKVAEALRKEGFYADEGVIDDPYETLKKELSLQLGASGYDSAVSVSEQDDAVSMELASSSFFEPGRATFTPKALPMLALLSTQLMAFANRDITVDVEGHTDDTPIATATYPSNWELSAARAANVVRYFVAQGFPAAKLRAVGLGETHPKAPNRDSTGNPIPGNQELNRRVVVKLAKERD